MKTTYLYIVLTLLSLLSIACEKINEVVDEPENTIETNSNHPHADRYENILESILNAGAPGVSITVSSPDGLWTKAGGMADLANGTFLNPAHVFRVGSITKLFTAATVLALQDEEILSIEDNINQYIPGYITDNISNANNVTIRQLLNHSSGIPEYLDINTILSTLNLSTVKNSAEENLEIVYHKEANFTPGTSNVYCNSNYLLLSLIIKHSTGKDAYQVVEEKIIDRLNLSYTSASTVLSSNLSRAYYDIYDNDFINDVTEIDNNAVGGDGMLDGGIISNSYDITLFMETLMNGTLLSENSLNQMLTFEDINEDLGAMDFVKDVGLGPWRLETNYGEAYGHYGNVYGFYGLVVYFPEQRVTLTILVNGYSAKILDVLENKEFFNTLFED